MVETTELEERLSRLATRFEDAIQENADAPGASGWGQFLDAAKRHKQVGPYGTAAGLIVFSLAKRSGSPRVDQAVSLLNTWWNRRNLGVGQSKEIFVQTLRLAFCNMALRLVGTHAAESLRKETESALLERIIPQGMWGNYWVSNSLHDSAPRLFPSALAVLSIALMRSDSSRIDGRVNAVADQLETKLALWRDLSMRDITAIAAAVLSLKGTAISRKTSWRLATISRLLPASLEEQQTYFFDFEYPTDSEEGIKFGRDYFIVSPEILLAIAGFQPGAPSALRLKAEGILTALVDSLRRAGDAYRPPEVDRLSSVDQAWAALLLKTASREHGTPSRASRAWYELCRNRKGNNFTNKVLPVFSFLFFAALNVVAKDWALSVRIAAAVGLAFVGALYGGRVRQLFPGRQDQG